MCWPESRHPKSVNYFILKTIQNHPPLRIQLFLYRINTITTIRDLFFLIRTANLEFYYATFQAAAANCKS